MFILVLQISNSFETFLLTFSNEVLPKTVDIPTIFLPYEIAMMMAAASSTPASQSIHQTSFSIACIKRLEE